MRPKNPQGDTGLSQPAAPGAASLSSPLRPAGSPGATYLPQRQQQHGAARAGRPHRRDGEDRGTTRGRILGRAGAGGRGLVPPGRRRTRHQTAALPPVHAGRLGLQQSPPKAPSAAPAQPPEPAAGPVAEDEVLPGLAGPQPRGARRTPLKQQQRVGHAAHRRLLLDNLARSRRSAPAARPATWESLASSAGGLGSAPGPHPAPWRLWPSRGAGRGGGGARIWGPPGATPGPGVPTKAPFTLCKSPTPAAWRGSQIP